MYTVYRACNIVAHTAHLYIMYYIQHTIIHHSIHTYQYNTHIHHVHRILIYRLFGPY